MNKRILPFSFYSVTDLRDQKLIQFTESGWIEQGNRINWNHKPVSYEPSAHELLRFLACVLPKLLY